jgi:hypothetical protein
MTSCNEYFQFQTASLFTVTLNGSPAAEIQNQQNFYQTYITVFAKILKRCEKERRQVVFTE